MNPVIILHGWSDTSDSFKDLAKWLRQNGFNAVDIDLGDYLSMNDEITVYDLGYAFRRALGDRRIPQDRHSFDLVVHSTGGLVAREYVRQVCGGNPGKTPVQRLCMLAPANFGSPLATVGKSMLGRMFKGWSWDHFAQSGKNILDALELAAPYSWELAEADLFSDSFPVFAADNTMVTIMVGTDPYGNALRASLHENGSDGTVRVSTANLNAHHLTLDFGDPDKPVVTERGLNCPEVAFAVFHRDHTTIHDPDDPSQSREWRETIAAALSLDPAKYADHTARCRAITNATFAAGADGAIPDHSHQYQHVAFRVRDQFRHPVDDYVVEFYQEKGDPKDKVFETIHTEILEKVTTNQTDGSYRSFLFDATDLLDYLSRNERADIRMSLSAVNLSERITFRNPEGGLDVFTTADRRLLFLNEPVLVDVTLYRDPSPEVFRISPFSRGAVGPGSAPSAMVKASGRRSPTLRDRRRRS